MRNKNLILAVIGGVILILIIFLFLNKQNTPIPISTPTGDKLSLPANDSKSTVSVNNYYVAPSATVIDEKDVLIETNASFDILAYYYNNERTFLIYLKNSEEPLEVNRQKAENVFIEKLGITKEQACLLTVSERLAANIKGSTTEDYGLSFCLNGVNMDVATFGGETGSGNLNPASGNCTGELMLEKIKEKSKRKIDPCLTFALLNTESGCTIDAQSIKGSCGISQLSEKIAGVSCINLKSNIDLSIQKGIDYFVSIRDSGKIRGNINGEGLEINQSIKDIYAAYNRGVACLDSSSRCDSSMKNSYGYPFVKWDCPGDVGDYRETIKATERFLESYRTCKTSSIIQGKLR